MENIDLRVRDGIVELAKYKIFYNDTYELAFSDQEKNQIINLMQDKYEINVEVLEWDLDLVNKVDKLKNTKIPNKNIAFKYLKGSDN